MSLQLVKKSTTDEFSTGGGADPVSQSVTLDQSGGTVDSTVINAELLATAKQYTDIELSITSEVAGMDYKLSLNGSAWFDALTSGSGGAAAGEIADIDASGSDQRTDIYIKVVCANDGSLSAGNFTAPNIQLTATGVDAP
jgi:hypothetical protein